MSLLPLQLESPSSSSARCLIKCNNPQHTLSPGMLAWNDAVKAGWTYDPSGEPYKSYYCKECSNKETDAKTTDVI